MQGGLKNTVDYCFSKNILTSFTLKKKLFKRKKAAQFKAGVS